jgi:Kef-type K+ transport system membrane component KefB
MTPSLVFLVQALVVVALPVAVLRCSRLTGLVPLVVAQIVVGIALGPSLFGRLAPEAYQAFFNKVALAPLSGIASIAVLFFSFITGLHLEPGIFRGRGRAFTAMAMASIAVPTLFGGLSGLWIAARYPEELSGHISPLVFATAVGICTGVTALPVLGAILHEMKLLGRRIGQLALGIAGFNDAALWILLGLLLTAASRQGPQASAVVVTLCVLLLYLTVMVWIIRPLLARVVVARITGEKFTRARWRWCVQLSSPRL